MMSPRKNPTTYRPDNIRCDICFKPFGDQIFMCKNGHPACGRCCVLMDRLCFCSEPIGDIRCRPLEKILAAMTRPCSFKEHGCREVVSYTESRGHEEACRYAPHHCPFHGCTYYGLHLYNHIQDDHANDPDEAAVIVRCNRRSTITLNKTMPFRVLLHRDGASMFLLVNGGDVLSGRSLSLPHGERRGQIQDGGEEAERPGRARALQRRGRALHSPAGGLPGQGVPLRAQLVLGLLRQRRRDGASHRRLVIQLGDAALGLVS